MTVQIITITPGCRLRRHPQQRHNRIPRTSAITEERESIAVESERVSQDYDNSTAQAIVCAKEAIGEVMKCIWNDLKTRLTPWWNRSLVLGVVLMVICFISLIAITPFPSTQGWPVTVLGWVNAIGVMLIIFRPVNSTTGKMAWLLCGHFLYRLLYLLAIAYDLIFFCLAVQRRLGQKHPDPQLSLLQFAAIMFWALLNNVAILTRDDWYYRRKPRPFKDPSHRWLERMASAPLMTLIFLILFTIIVSSGHIDEFSTLFGSVWGFVTVTTSVKIWEECYKDQTESEKISLVGEERWMPSLSAPSTGDWYIMIKQPGNNNPEDISKQPPLSINK